MNQNTSLRHLRIIWQAPPRWDDLSFSGTAFAQRLAALNDPGAAARMYLSLCLADCCYHRCSLADALIVCLTTLAAIPFTPAIQRAILARVDQISRDSAAFAVLQEAYGAFTPPAER